MGFMIAGIIFGWLFLGWLGLFIVNKMEEQDVDPMDDLMCVLVGPITLVVALFFLIGDLADNVDSRPVGNFYRMITGRKKTENTRSLY